MNRRLFLGLLSGASTLPALPAAEAKPVPPQLTTVCVALYRRRLYSPGAIFCTKINVNDPAAWEKLNESLAECNMGSIQKPDPNDCCCEYCAVAPTSGQYSDYLALLLTGDANLGTLYSTSYEEQLENW